MLPPDSLSRKAPRPWRPRWRLNGSCIDVPSYAIMGAVMEMEDEFYTLVEVARLLKCSKDSVYRWLRAGKLKGIRPSDKFGWRIRRSDLEAFLAELKAKAVEGRPTDEG